MEERLRRSQKLEAIGRLAGGVAHDFNNVLTAIMGNISMAKRRMTTHWNDPQTGQMLTAAERASRRAADLVRQLLNYAGKGRRDVRQVDIRQVVEDALAIVRASVSRKITIHNDLPDAAATIEADVTQLQQLVLNLMLNAAESIGENHGEVWVKLRIREVSEAELAERYGSFSLLSHRPYTEIQVRDTGAGMDDRTLEQIFDPFFTTKFMGRGLGLAAALGIVRSHGGGIAVESAPGRGSTFTVLLPAEQVTPAPMTVADAVTETARGEGLVLVIDDEVGIRSLLQSALEDLGYTVLTAENGRQGVELFERSPAINLVLIDLNMPVMDGGETAAAIQLRNPDIPLLIMSGTSDHATVQRLGDVRISGFVPKPFSPEQLAQAVAMVRMGAARWVGQDRREQLEPSYAGPERRASS